jgi:ComF family protein
MAGQYIDRMAWPPLPRTARWPGLARRCAVCSGWGPATLCAPCLQRFAADLPRCPRCAEHSPGGQTCGACLRQPPVYLAAVAAVDYGFPWEGLVRRFKFHAQPDLAAALASVMATAVARHDATTVQHVLPVPLSAARLAERGYNQAWELARRVARRLGRPAQVDWLARLRDTPHQVGLSRQARTQNLRDAFWVPPPAIAAVRGQHLALVDDVLTTGVTATAASQALLAAGAASVQLWVLARTPAPDGSP